MRAWTIIFAHTRTTWIHAACAPAHMGSIGFVSTRRIFNAKLLLGVSRTARGMCRSMSSWPSTRSQTEYLISSTNMAAAAQGWLPAGAQRLAADAAAESGRRGSMLKPLASLGVCLTALASWGWLPKLPPCALEKPWSRSRLDERPRCGPEGRPGSPNLRR